MPIKLFALFFLLFPLSVIPCVKNKNPHLPPPPFLAIQHIHFKTITQICSKISKGLMRVCFSKGMRPLFSEIQEHCPSTEAIEETPKPLVFSPATPSLFPFADLSFLVVDFKYSQAHGIKICEVQHAALSFFEADPFLHGSNGRVSPLWAKFCASFPQRKWVTHLAFPPLAETLSEMGWHAAQNRKALEEDPEFQAYGALVPEDPSKIEAYAGIAYCSSDLAQKASLPYSQYPGILFVDRVTLPYWIDKYQMNRLFEKRDILRRAKAEWRRYPKIYRQELAQEIEEALPASCYVIKPNNQFSGHGVLIVPKEHLDRTLQLILTAPPSLRHHRDRAYAYWSLDANDSFLIEKYYPSDPLILTHKPSLASKKSGKGQGKNSAYSYDATLRFFVALSCNLKCSLLSSEIPDGPANGEIFSEGSGHSATFLKHSASVNSLFTEDLGEKPTAQILSHYTVSCLSLGGYWQLPRKAAEETATLNEQKKSYGDIPYYHLASPELLERITPEIEEIMRNLYEEMLKSACAS